MKLFYSTTSPFVRKVRMAAMELGLADDIELVAAGPLGPTGEVAAQNPIGKIPALELDDGTRLFDSSVICAYLNDVVGGNLIPPSGLDRARTLTLEAMADGTMDAGVLRMMESRRPEDERSPAWVQKQTQVCQNGLDALEAQADRWGDACSMGQIAVCCLLAWFEFRPIEPHWRDGRPALADWYAGFSARASAQATEPYE